jgi:hypothetical protein
VDLDGDGKDDILSGSYWPGDITVFRGKGDGTYEKGEVLKDAEGKNLSSGGPWKSDREPDTDSLAASPFAFDHDGDGDLDLLVGNIAGRVILIPNEGTARKPSFDARKRRALQAGGAVVKVPGGDAGPTVADWDQDGKADLLVGAGDGSVWFYRNVGTREAPEYAKGAALLSKSGGGYSNALPHGGAPARPGTRTKLCVTDWDGDGRVDLLVGDLWYEKAAEVKLSPEQVARRDALKKQQRELNQRYVDLLKELGTGSEDPRLKKLLEEMSAVAKEVSPLDPHATPHGSVWLYRRAATK